ncbi:uncharacterized protein [Cardiocondyla obscurior]|uniref:uncharacterized protein n=1 Tax=Cardiocondyla obscurior TaxID=286306 RepID=UPI0039657F4E
MADRIKILIQKRTALKTQITTITNLVEKSKLDHTNLKLRLTRLTELYHAFEEHHNELMLLDSNDEHQTEFINLQERYYDIATKIHNILSPASTSSISSINNDSRSIESPILRSNKERRVKLPETPLPIFHGKYEEWLTFKNKFRDLIDSQSDLSELSKLNYLKASLKGEAANKVNIFTIDGTNYSKAWEILERAYGDKRILVSRHLSLLRNMPNVDKENSSNLSKLADETQQHIASLNALGISVGSEMVVNILESKLPRTILDKWETSLERDQFPSLDEFYEFLYKTAVCVSKRERNQLTDLERNKGEPMTKRRRINNSHNAFTINTSRNCIACKNKIHPLYVCDKFQALSVPKRIELVKRAKVCFNCFRSHLGLPCKSGNCTVCHKKHNTLLHLNHPLAIENSEKSEPKTSETIKSA